MQCVFVYVLFCYNKRKINYSGNIDNFFPPEVCVLGVKERGTLKIRILADLEVVAFKALSYCSSVVGFLSLSPSPVWRRRKIV